jgi:hypothetical protein
MITAAFISMADIIASDSSLISRLRADIKDYNTQAGGDNSEGDEYSPNVSPADFEEPEEPTVDTRGLK